MRLSLYKAAWENPAFLRDNATVIEVTPEEDLKAHPGVVALSMKDIRVVTVESEEGETGPPGLGGGGTSQMVEAVAVTQHAKGVLFKLTFDARVVESTGQDRLQHTEIMGLVLDRTRWNTWQDSAGHVTIGLYAGDDSAENLRANWTEIFDEVALIQKHGIVVELPCGKISRVFPEIILPADMKSHNGLFGISGVHDKHFCHMCNVYTLQRWDFFEWVQVPRMGRDGQEKLEWSLADLSEYFDLFEEDLQDINETAHGPEQRLQEITRNFQPLPEVAGNQVSRHARPCRMWQCTD